MSFLEGEHVGSKRIGVFIEAPVENVGVGGGGGGTQF
jgi:hypothetical protein